VYNGVADDVSSKVTVWRGGGSYQSGQEAEIEERSFVAEGAPQDDGQRRVGAGIKLAAEPDRRGGLADLAEKAVEPHSKASNGESGGE
jgi:hypothetical protein